jgi:hypothetical protein
VQRVSISMGLYTNFSANAHEHTVEIERAVQRFPVRIMGAQFHH